MSEAMSCSCCGNTAKLVDRSATYRRGDKTVKIPTQCWTCPDGCPDPDGDKPFLWYDVHQLKANDENARIAWLAKYNEPMPSVRRKE